MSTQSQEQLCVVQHRVSIRSEMAGDIKTKLATELNKNFEGESQIVYILSIIGKIIEVKNCKAEFPVLDFYRNWSLHSRIERRQLIQPMLISFVENSPLNLLFHDDLRTEINKFLQREGLSKITIEKWEDFRYFLGKVIGDTPLIIRGGSKRYRLVFQKPLDREVSELFITMEVS